MQDGTKASAHLHHALVLARTLQNCEYETQVHDLTASLYFLVQRNPHLVMDLSVSRFAIEGFLERMQRSVVTPG